jgi:HAD superfamily hydrolase (TIGR01549 family)
MSGIKGVPMAVESSGKLDIPRIKAICFDVDGTLRDTDEQYIGRVGVLLNPFRLFFPNRNTAGAARSLVMRFEDPVNGLFSWADRLGLDGPLHRIVELGNPWQRRKKRPGYYQLVPDIHPALEKMAKKFKLAVITVRSSRSTRGFLELTDLARYFKFTASGQTAPRTKPFPDQIFWVAEKLGIAPENCLMVGDTTIDIRAGKAAGAQTVGVLSGFGEEGELRARGADLILPSVAALPAALGI